MTSIEDKLQRVRQRICSACAAAQREPDEVLLLAVSKTVPAQGVAAAAACGQRAFGENYIQEGVDKQRQLAHLGLEWHCIGPIQGNKTRLVAEHFDWAHSVDRLKIAQRLSQQRPADRPPLNVCIQLDAEGSATKAGVPPAEALVLAREVVQLPGLRLRGLMHIPEPSSSFDAQLASHRRARAVYDELRAAGLPLDTLSMGMSDDLEAAVAAGSTMVRVGTAIFGARPKAGPDR
ncbi:YggS family pyridoxal phosphate-dependent enzyme [Ramlibacter rhizophilus]|uniref:Pyridoxal phosphate homeostasis protein n=1 Tax=Ramlibacter rhizophilus TaxID=1781167 RepID=A0A4Z0BD03_9BURK|nr:YggS family pyridoxal phosphate-dependent enzyme [Ramlibacter rhizophilus]TFY96259.1 YggS family pyridoxal phosphate-dependent enzyme [Ramlibacter rhizophilus]